VLKYILIIILTIQFWSSVNAHAQSNDNVEILTANLSPYSMKEGPREGYLVEIIAMVEERVGVKSPLRYLPWTRAQRLAKTENNKIIFPLTRIKQREEHYTWLFDVAPIELVFVVKGEQEMTMEQARSLPWVTVQKSTPFEHFLRDNGFRNLIESPSPSDVHIRLLERGRVEAWFTARILARYALRDYKEKDFAISRPVISSRVYIAASKHFPKDLVNKYRKAYNELVGEGKIKEILQKYGYEKRVYENINPPSMN